jgi:hypothetical protein
MLGLWCLTPLSTCFSYFVAGFDIRDNHFILQFLCITVEFTTTCTKRTSFHRNINLLLPWYSKHGSFVFKQQSRMPSYTLYDLILEIIILYYSSYVLLFNSKMASFFGFVDKRAIYWWYNLIRTCAGECAWLFHWQHNMDCCFSELANGYKNPIWHEGPADIISFSSRYNLFSPWNTR